MRAYIFGTLIAVTATTLGACVKGDDCDFGDCASPTNGEGGSDAPIGEGGADVVQPPAGCDPAADPKDAPKCVASDFGVFVDATSGADANPGTRESPVKSIAAALGKLGNKNRGPRERRTDHGGRCRYAETGRRAHRHRRAGLREMVGEAPAPHPERDRAGALARLRARSIAARRRYQPMALCSLIPGTSARGPRSRAAATGQRAPPRTPCPR